MYGDVERADIIMEDMMMSKRRYQFWCIRYDGYVRFMSFRWVYGW